MKKLAKKIAFIMVLGSFALTACAAPSNNVTTTTTAAPASATTPAKKAVVYFTKDISAAGLEKLYQKINSNIDGKVAVKIHTGEPKGPNINPPSMVQPFQATIPNSTLVETNTYYGGGRDTTAKHIETLKINGWTAPVDILDADGTVMLPIKGGKHFKEMSVGKNILNYNSAVILTHFKGHTMGGLGGSIKNVSIGFADGQIGKKMQHTAPNGGQWSITGAAFMENMVEAAKAVTDHFGNKIVYMNVMRNMSVDCDCAGVSAAPPTAPNIGILASTDIVAIDQASVDLIMALPEAQRHDLKERMESRQGLRQLSYGNEIGLGTTEYELVSID